MRKRLRKGRRKREVKELGDGELKRRGKEDDKEELEVVASGEYNLMERGLPSTYQKQKLLTPFNSNDVCVLF